MGGFDEVFAEIEANHPGWLEKMRAGNELRRQMLDSERSLLRAMSEYLHRMMPVHLRSASPRLIPRTLSGRGYCGRSWNMATGKTTRLWVSFPSALHPGRIQVVAHAQLRRRVRRPRLTRRGKAGA